MIKILSFALPIVLCLRESHIIERTRVLGLKPMNADVASLHPKNEATTGKTSTFASYWGLKDYELFSQGTL